MPSSRPSPPTPGSSRRRPGPALPSGWVWRVIFGMALAMLWVMTDLSTTTINYDAFIKLIDKNLVDKVTFAGKDRIVGELNETKAAEDPDVKSLKLRGSKFSVNLLPGENRSGLEERLLKAGVKISSEPESTWVGPLLMMLLPALLLLGVFFFFFLPRIRDPLGGSFLNRYLKSPARRYEKNKSRVPFGDVAEM